MSVVKNCGAIWRILPRTSITSRLLRRQRNPQILHGGAVLQKARAALPVVRLVDHLEQQHVAPFLQRDLAAIAVLLERPRLGKPEHLLAVEPRLALIVRAERQREL